ncbi:hypothetical protein [Streptomyces decoyicus]
MAEGVVASNGYRSDSIDRPIRASGSPLADPTRPYGVLVIDATRLMEEFQYTGDVLQHHVDQRAPALSARTTGSTCALVGEAAGARE